MTPTPATTAGGAIAGATEAAGAVVDAPTSANAAASGPAAAIAVASPTPATGAAVASPTPATGTSVASPTPADIRDIRGPVPLPIPWLVPLLIAGGVVLLLALGWLVRRWWRRRAGRVPPPRPADEVALERLEAARSLLDPTHAREFCFAVTEAIRLYVEDRFALRAARRTTDEFLADLARADDTPLAAHAPALDDFLHRADLVKFARAGLERGEMEAMHASAVRLVRETRPGAEPASRSTAAGPEHAA